MARIADKHGLTNKYRSPGMKRVVKRGRSRKYLFGAPSRRKRKVYRYAPQVRNKYTGYPIAKKEKKEHPILNKVLAVVLMIVSAPITFLWIGAIIEKNIGLAFVASGGIAACVLAIMLFKGNIN